jgi:hypothetical protein
MIVGENIMNTHTVLSKLRDFNLGPKFGKYRITLDFSTYMRKQQECALSSKLFRVICCVVEHTVHPTNEQLLNNWVRLFGSTLFALFYRHD